MLILLLHNKLAEIASRNFLQTLLEFENSMNFLKIALYTNTTSIASFAFLI